MDSKQKALLTKAGAVIGITLALLLIGGCTFLVANSSSCARKQAIWESEYGYGVERHVTLYDFNGEVVEEWSGRMDVLFRNDGNVDLVFFDGEKGVERRIVVNVGYGQLVVDSTMNGS